MARYRKLTPEERDREIKESVKTMRLTYRQLRAMRMARRRLQQMLRKAAK